MSSSSDRSSNRARAARYCRHKLAHVGCASTAAARDRTAVKNALELMADAEILLNSRRPRRGYALGIIATEEAAKHLVCKDVLTCGRNRSRSPR